MPVKRATKKVTGLEVEEVKEPETVIADDSDEVLFLVKLDSKRFEGRTIDQAIDLLRGSVGVVSKITIERQ